MQNNNFEGIFTAIVTPFKSDFSVDFDAFDALIERQIEVSVSGIVVCSTTGESSTLKACERLELVKKAAAKCKGKIKLIAGASSNSSAHACELQQNFEELDIDATMHCAPWYNKPNQNGIYAHFRMINEVARKPIFLYNVPSRCGVDIEAETIIELAQDCSNIIGIKDTNTDPLRMQNYLSDLRQERPEFKVLSGEDGFLLPLLAMGGHGLISTTSNLAPAKFVDLYSAFKTGNIEKSQVLANELAPLIQLMFLDTNPIPLKTALSAQDLIKLVFRLPLLPIDNEDREIIIEALDDLGWLKR